MLIDQKFLSQYKNSLICRIGLLHGEMDVGEVAEEISDWGN